MSMRSVSSLPLYSPREADEPHSPHSRKSEDHSFESDDDDEEEEDEDDHNELEMDTLNKNSQGRGGWKMLGSGDGNRSQPGSPTTPNSPRARHVQGSPQTGGKSNAKANNNFERFTFKEIAAMLVPLFLVMALTGIALHIVIAG
jgi:hypothetical protein